MTRAPLEDLDPADLPGVRLWLLALAAMRVIQEGRLAPGLRFLTGAIHEHVDLSDLSEVDEPYIGWFFRELGRRPGVIRSFREGEMTLPEDDEGTRRRAAVVLEIDVANDRYWLAWRHVGEKALRVGVVHGDWTESEGSVADLGPPFSDWLASGEVERGEVRESESDVELPDVMAGFAELATEPVWTPAELAEVVGRVCDHDLVHHGLVGILVLVLRGRTVEKWLIEGRLPCSVDDVVRSIVRLGECDATVLVLAGVARVDGVDHRAYVATIECRGQRGQRIVPLHVESDGRITAPRALYRALPTPGVGEGWIGVEPGVVLQLAPFTAPGGTAEG